MPGKDQVLGIVENSAFYRIPIKGKTHEPTKLTTIKITEAIHPDACPLNLSRYEGLVIVVNGHDRDGYIWEANVVEQAGPSLSSLLRKTFGFKGDKL